MFQLGIYWVRIFEEDLPEECMIGGNFTGGRFPKAVTSFFKHMLNVNMRLKWKYMSQF